jgi:tetratricopeptide (TPR) repeat protein
MKLRPKTVRRGLALAVAGTGVVAGGWLLHWRSENAKHQQLLRERDAGLALVESGDYEPALQPLGRYLARNDRDRDALFAYATARSRVEVPGDRHVGEAIRVLASRLLASHPDDLPASELLLELYTDIAANDEAIALADRVLAAHPDNLAALRARSIALSRTTRVSEALAASQRVNAVAPRDVKEQLRTIWLMWRAGMKPPELQAHAQQYAQANPGDPRADLLLAVACGYANDRDAAIAHLRAAAQRPDLDADVIQELVGKFDGLKRFDESRALLDRAVNLSGDLQIQRMLVSRLWQEGRHDDVLARLAALDPDDARSDAALLGYRTLSLAATGRREQALAILAALERRTGDGLAKAWEQALGTQLSDPPLQPRDAIVRLRGAIARDRDNGLIRAWMGDAYWRLGEAELAIQSWADAAELFPAWSDPMRKISRARLSAGAVDEALAAAQETFRRSSSLESAINLVVVRFRKLETSPREVDANELLQQVQQVQATIPNEPRTLPIQVALLARTGKRDAAIARIREALASDPPPDAQTLLNLSTVSRTEQLGLQQVIFDAADAESRTPMLVLSQAGDLADAGKTADGLALLTRASQSSGGGVEWDMAIAQYLESVSDPAAAGRWIALGDRYPEDLDVQRLILSAAESVRGDRAFFARTIERLRQLTGEAGQQWKLERAKWLLASNQYDDSVAAVALLTEIIQRGLSKPRIYLARALEQTGNVNTAMEHLKAASDQQPRDPQPVIELSRLLRRAGKLEDARRFLVRVARDGVMSAGERLTVASLLGELNEIQHASDLLAAAEFRGANDPAGRVLLAELYRKLGMADDAQRLYDALLGAPEPSAMALLSAADFYASTARRDEADAVLARLEDERFSPATRAMVQARFSELHGDEQHARTLYARATELAPEEAGHWVRRVEFEMARRRFADAAALANQALAGGISDPRLATLRLEAETLQQSVENPSDLRPLIRSLARDPSRAAQVEMLTALQDARDRKLGNRETALRLREAADRFPRFLPLQEHVVRLYVAAGMRDEAVTLAMRTMESLPASGEAAALAVEAARVAGRWAEMRQAAERWRQRGLSGGERAEVALVEACLNLRNAREAMRVVERWLPTLQQDMTASESMRRMAVATLILSDRDAEARALMEPLIDGSASWRSFWLAATAELRDPAIASEWIRRGTPPVTQLTPELASQLAGAWSRVVARTADAAAAREALAMLELSAADHKPDARHLLHMGQLQLFAGSLDAAEQTLAKALAASPDDPETLNNLAYVQLRIGRDLASAEANARKAVGHGGRVAAYRDTLARVLLAAGRSDEARQQFEAALDADPQSVDAWVGLATLHSAAGRTADAAAALKRAETLLAQQPPPIEPVRHELRSLQDALTRSTDVPD